MKTATVIYQGNLRCEMTHNNSGDVVITDAPVDNQGNGAAFSPTDMVASSLATCMFTIMGIYARHKGIMIEHSKADVTKIMSSEGPRRISEIMVTFSMKLSPDEPEIRQALMNAAKTCPVALSLSKEIIQSVTFNF
jgi:putative redox protein